MHSKSLTTLLVSVTTKSGNQTILTPFAIHPLLVARAEPAGHRVCTVRHELKHNPRALPRYMTRPQAIHLQHTKGTLYSQASTQQLCAYLSIDDRPGLGIVSQPDVVIGLVYSALASEPQVSESCRHLSPPAIMISALGVIKRSVDLLSLLPQSFSVEATMYDRV